MAKVYLLLTLEVLLSLIAAGWASLWILKPTKVWTRKWKAVEEKASSSVFGYSGLNFAVYTFPVIAFTILGLIYMNLKPREPRNRSKTTVIRALTNPFLVSSRLGVLSRIEFFAISIFIIFLGWTFYARVSSDYKKMTPIKFLKLNMWQYKVYKIATRCGLLAEACLALLLFPILRGISIFRVLGIQFEASVRYHTWLGTIMIFFATLHGAGTIFIWGVKHQILDEMRKWQRTGRIYLAGEIALATGLIILITSLPPLRRKHFEIFHLTHHLYLVFFVFFLFHAGDRHFYMVFPGVFIFGLDKMLRIIYSRPKTCILSARIFPCNAVELTLPKDPSLKYTPTSVIFVKIPSISKFQWHPFSITSCSFTDKSTMSIIIKPEGLWTRALFNTVVASPDSEADQSRCIPVAVEGPYGPASLDFLCYDALLLIAGGIGVTPFLSIFQDIASAQGNGRNAYPGKIQLILSVKKSQDIYLLYPILPLLQNVEQLHLKLKVFVTQEKPSGLTLGEVLRNLSQVRVVNFKTAPINQAISGLENSLWMAAIAGISSILFIVILSFLNHAILSPDGMPSKQKNPSSVIDLLLTCSFTLVILISALVAVLARWKRVRKMLSPVSGRVSKTEKIRLPEGYGALDDHEIHFGQRPNFEDLFAKSLKETGGSNIGVFVCGPETMKESVASTCQISSQTPKMNDPAKKPYFSFNSLNFTL